MNYSRPITDLTAMFERIHAANAFYARIARQMRADCSHRRAHSTYRARAAGLRLRVNTERAAALSDRHVSKVPLPVLDNTPSPTAPRLVVRIPPFHTRPLHAPHITINGNGIAPMGTSANGSFQSRHGHYPYGNNWGVPGAPLLKTKELPALSPSREQSPSSQDSESSSPITPEDHQPRLAKKRKISAVDLDKSNKRHLGLNWARAAGLVI